MMDDDKFFYESNPVSSNYFKNMFIEVQDESNKIKKRKGLDYPIFIGVDWAEDSGMNRGDVISRNDNVIEVRFKTATVK